MFIHDLPNTEYTQCARLRVKLWGHCLIMQRDISLWSFDAIKVAKTPQRISHIKNGVEQPFTRKHCFGENKHVFPATLFWYKGKTVIIEFFSKEGPCSKLGCIEGRQQKILDATMQIFGNSWEVACQVGFQTSCRSQLAHRLWVTKGRALQLRGCVDSF